MGPAKCEMIFPSVSSLFMVTEDVRGDIRLRSGPPVETKAASHLETFFKRRSRAIMALCEVVT